MVVVFDSSVLIPVIIKASRSARLFWRLLDAGHEVAISPALFDEVADKVRTKQTLRDWLNLSEKQIEQFLADLPQYCVVVPGYAQAHGAVPADPKDDMIIATALEARGHYIVSEDKHLLDLQSYQGVRILTREQMEAELDRLGVPKLESE